MEGAQLRQLCLWLVKTAPSGILPSGWTLSMHSLPVMQNTRSVHTDMAYSGIPDLDRGKTNPTGTGESRSI